MTRTDELAGFETLAQATAITLPGLLRHLLATGKTSYGPDWAAMAHERCLREPPALVACWDFEWMDANESRGTIEEWLHPDFQGGRRFLPFGQSGGGDAWCLVSFDDGVSASVALIRHDAGTSQTSYHSFSDFVCIQFLQACADMDSLLESGFSEQEACEVMRADARGLAQGMDAPTGAWLQALCAGAPVRGPEGVLALLSPQQLEIELRQFTRPATPPFPIVARWNCEPPGRRT